MKKIAVMCLLASLILSSGQVTAMAQPWDNVENMETVQQNITDAQSDIISESDIQSPEDWDPEDPQNARAYEQLMESTDAEDASQTPVLYSADARAAAVTTTWGGKTYTHNDFNTEDCDVVPCIDVSYHQGTIDWTKVKNAGIDYVILRAGYRASASGTLNKDKMFETYIKDAQKAGLKVGAYIYSQAISVEEAEAEANFILNRIKNYTIDLPVVFDYEYYGAQEGRLYNAHLSKSEKTKCAEAFCKKVSAAGYQAMVYANASFCESELDTAALHKKYQIWMARYNSYSYKESRDKGVRYGGQIDFWQCSESAKVDGIDSTSVDFNWWYKSKNAQAGSGVVYDSAMGAWVYQVNGKIDTDYTGVAYNSNGWWYVKNGKVDFTYTGLASNENGWWYVKNGQVDFKYNGFAENENGWWYLEDGKVTFSKNGVEYGTVKGKTGWWHIKESQADLTYTGFAENEKGWWYLEDGKVTFAKDGIEYGTVKGKTGWWHIRGSQVVYDTTVAENENGWWRVKNGQVDFTYTGFADNENGDWYVENGQVTFGKDSIEYGTVKGKKGWWHVKNSRVVYDTTVAENENGWWYVKDGKVDFAYDGLAENENGWWYLEGGQVTFQYTGIAENENGTWYVKTSQVDFTYSGKVVFDKIAYVIKNGKADASSTEK